MNFVKRFTLPFFILGIIFIITSAVNAENPHKDKLNVLLNFAEPLQPDSSLIPVEFEFHIELSPNDSGVGINGTFNDWGDVYKLEYVGGDKWVRTLYLEPGMYSYKFVTYVDTVGQAGVTGWYTDPLNPEFTGPYRNSNILVKDPMIYYFLPVRDSEVNNPLISITAKLSTTMRNHIVPETISFTIDNNTITDPWNYFNTETNKLIYTPEQEFEYTSHELKLSAQNNLGITVEEMTNFSIVRGIIEAPYTLTFDGKSPLLELRGDVERVSFEWMDQPVTDELLDPDNDGIFTKDKNLKVNAERFYRVIVNQDVYLENDPTNPVINRELRSVVTKKINPFPRLISYEPKQGKVFHTIDTTITFKAKIVPSDSGYALNQESAMTWFDGVQIDPTTQISSDTLIISFSTNVGRGRHQIQYWAEDEAGVELQESIMTMGAYPEGSGFHYIDPENDDNGYGTYTYESTFPPNSADILAIHTDFIDNFDSLHIKVEMEHLSANTRVGFYILNNLEGQLVEANDDVELRLPEWEEHGAFISLADPSTPLYRPVFDNRLFLKKTSTSETIPVQFNEAKLISQELDFTVSLKELEAELGTFNKDWYFIAYSYFMTTSGSYEIEEKDGGVVDIEDPDILDLAFCEGVNSQTLLLKNYISSRDIGGPRFAAIGTEDRGAVRMNGQLMDDNYIPAPSIELLARGGDIYQSEVTIVGRIDSDEITEVSLHVNELSYTVLVVDSLFEQIIELDEGSNIIYASAVYGTDLITISVPVEYNYIYDKTPKVVIESAVENGIVSLDGSASFSPEGRKLRFSWRQDETNPQEVQFSSRTKADIDFEAPTIPGEYYFTLVATAGTNVGWAREVIVVDDSAHTVEDETWHPAWVDSMILYEIFVRTYDFSSKLSAVKSNLYALKQQGVNCIWFMPIHPSPSTHGYWITDYYDINPEYGTLDDFQKLVQEAHRNGIKVILDLVINHTGDTHPFMLDAVENGEYSPYRDFYYWKPDGTYEYLYSWVNLPSINFSTEWVRDYLINMSKWWIQKYNIDGFRCDVAHAVETGRLEGPEFWQRWRRELKQIKPDIFLLAEAAAGDPRYFDEKFDSAYDYWLYGTTKNALGNTADADDFRNVMRHHTTVIPNHARPMRFIENHDESRFFENYSKPQTKLASALDFILPGVPLIYAGQEVGELTSRGLIDWTDPEKLGPHYEMLIELRKSNHALNFGSHIDVPCENKKVYPFIRKSSEQTVMCVTNLSSSSQDASLKIPIEQLPFDPNATIYLNDLVNGTSTTISVSDLANYEYKINPYLFTVIEFSDVATNVESNQSPSYSFRLYENYPNPFNSETKIDFSIGGNNSSMTKIVVYNVLGQKVRTLLDKRMTPGDYSIRWDGNDNEGIPVGTGLYMCQIKSADYVKSIKMLVLK